MLKILIEDSEGKSKIAPINPDTDITIGRKEGNSIRLKERNVSRQHARIFSTPDGLFIEPVAARYGLKVNSTKIDGPTQLALGDEVQIGDYRLYIQDEDQVNPRDQLAASDAVVDIEPNMRPRFVVISSNFAGIEYNIVKTSVTIGRTETCDICIRHNSVSGQHAEIRRTPRGDFEIRDLNSSNGTKVNGIAISEPTRLNGGDCVTLGHIVMRYCPPGDLWSLNYGINSDNSGPSPLFFALALLVVAALCVCGTLLLVDGGSDDNPQKQTAQTNNKDESNAQLAMKVMSECSVAIDEGDFDTADTACNEFARLQNNAKMANVYLDKLKKGKEARDYLISIRQDLDNGNCQDANDTYERLENDGMDTHAYRTSVKEDLKSRITDCRVKKLTEQAMSAIDEGDFATAESNMESIRDIAPSSPELDTIQNAIKEKRPAPSRSSSRSSKSKSSKDKADAPAQKVNVEKLCQEAVAAKMKDKCKSYTLYKKALETGQANEKCKKFAQDTIRLYRSQCE